MFLNELEEIMDNMTLDSIDMIAEIIFKKLNSCISSEHFQVAERSLFMFNNDKINVLLRNNKSIAFPTIIEGLMKNSRAHWNP